MKDNRREKAERLEVECQRTFRFGRLLLLFKEMLRLQWKSYY